MLMDRHVVVDAPFTGGIVTDRLWFQLAPQECTLAFDLIAPNGLAQMRRAWLYDGTVADSAVRHSSVARQQFVLSNTTRTITTTTTSLVYIHNPAGAGTLLYTGGGEYIPRCVYRDELILCAQDGLHPIMRYSGSATTFAGLATPGTWTAGQSTLTAGGGGFNAATGPGSYVTFVTGGPTAFVPLMWCRILERNSATNMTVEGVKAVLTTVVSAEGESPVGFTWPAVAIYNAGTISVAANAVTGVGTKWSALVKPTQADYGSGDALLTVPAAGGTALQSYISAVGGDTTMTSVRPNVTNSSYAITRRLPFTDAAAHRGSLWGTGVKQFPDRVYVSPPGWNPSLPPGFVEPFDPTADAASTNANDFLLSYVDVPSPYDGDFNVAILPSPGPLLVLKHKAIYGVYGSYPNFQVSLIDDGVGCIDIRSAVSGEYGQYWASDTGIYAYTNGKVVDLTAGSINAEWRDLMRIQVATGNAQPYVACGVTRGYLIVAVSDRTNIVNLRTYVYDLRRRVWISRFNNVLGYHFWLSKMAFDDETLFGVGIDLPTGRVANYTPMFSPTFPAGGTALDPNGTGYPYMSATSSWGLAQTSGIDGEAKLLDAAFMVNLVDPAAVSTMSLGVAAAQGLEPAAPVGASATATAVTASAPKRWRFDCNTTGRRHSISAAMTGSVQVNTQLAQVIEAVLRFRDARSMT